MEAYLRKNPILIVRAILVLFLCVGLVQPVQSANPITANSPQLKESNVSCQLSLQVSCDVKMWQEKLALQPVNLSVEALPDAPTISQKPAVKPVSGSPQTVNQLGGRSQDNSSLSSNQIVAIIDSYDWPTNIAYGIAMCESGLNPLATHHNTNGSIDRGIFQINSIHGANSTYNVQANIAYAYTLWRAQGWQPWTTWQDGCYKRYL